MKTLLMGGLRALLLLSLWTSPALAQSAPAASLEQLRTHVKPRQSIEVLTQDKGIVSGRFIDATGEGLSLEVDGVGLEIAASRVVEVARPDSAVDGLLIGAGVGALAGFGMYIALNAIFTESDDLASTAGYFLPFTAGGAFAGLLVDAAHNGRRIVYRRQGTGLSVVPLVRPGGAGVRVTWQF